MGVLKGFPGFPGFPVFPDIPDIPGFLGFLGFPVFPGFLDIPVFPGFLGIPELPEIHIFLVLLKLFPMKREERYTIILDHFRKEMPNVTTELDFDSEFHLLVAVMLSAQCTDKRVNMVTPELFRQYPTPQSLADATEDDVFALVKSVSYPNAKSRHLVEMARQLVERFDSVVPQTLDELVTLSGVGRKTANVMLSVAFGQGAMPVDTHVYRVSHRIGLVNDSDNTPLKVEQRLSRYIPKEELGLAHHWLLLHGRYVCTARKAHCYRCPIAHVCKSNEKR